MFKKTITIAAILILSLLGIAQETRPLPRLSGEDPLSPGPGREARRLSLEEAIAVGLESSPALHASAMRVEAQSAKVREASANRLPALRFGGGYTRLSEIPPFAVTLPILPAPIVVSQNYFNSYSLRLGFQQPLFTGFRLEAGEASARMIERSAGQDLAKDKADFILAVKSAYWGLARARQFEAVIGENVRQVAEHLKDVRAYFDQGLLTRNEVLRAELELSNAKILEIDARDAVEVALTSLDSLIGLPVGSDVELATSVESAASKIPVPEEGAAEKTSFEKAWESRPDLKAAEFRIKAFESGVKAARGGFYPQVFLSGNYYYLRPNPRILPALDRFKGTWDVGVSLSFDVWNWGLTRSQARQAEAQLAQARDARKLLEDQAVLEITQCRLSLARAGEKVRATALAVAQAEENLRVTRERFKQGVALNNDVLDAEVALLQARLGRTQAGIDQVLAQARLEKALGQ